MSASRQAITSSLRWISAAKLSGQLVNWAITFVVLRLLAPSDYGMMAMATVFVSFISMFADMGLGVAVIQSRECSRERLSEIFGAVLLLNITLTVLLALLAGPIAYFYDEPRLAEVLRVLSLQFTIAAFSAMPRAWLQREMRFKAFSAIEVSGALLTGITTLVLAWMGHGVWSLVLGNMIGIIWPALLANWLAPLKVWPSFRFAESAEMLKVGRNVTTSRVLWYFISQADVFIVGKLLGKELLGFYSVAIQLSSMPMSKVMSIVNQVALSGFAHIQDDRTAVRQGVLQGVMVIAFVAFPLFWGMSSVAVELVAVVLGDRWQEAVLPLQIIPLVIPLRMIVNYVSTAAQGIGKSEVDVRNTLQGFLIMPPAIFFGAHYGLVGVCFAWLIVVPYLFIGNVKRLVGVFNVSVYEFYSYLIFPFFLSLCMYVVVFVVRFFLQGSIAGFLLLCILVLVGVTTYLGGFYLIGRERLHNVMRIIFQLSR